MDRYELRGSIKDTRQQKSLYSTELIHSLKTEPNYTYQELNGYTLIQYTGHLFYITSYVEDVIRQTIEDDPHTKLSEKIAYGLSTFCSKIIMIIESYIVEDLSGYFYSPLCFWKIIEEYLMSHVLKKTKLLRALQLTTTDNEAATYYSMRLDSLNNNEYNGIQISGKTKPYTILAYDTDYSRRQRVDDVEYFIEWYSPTSRKPRGLHFRHWYDTFSYNHVHRMAKEEDVRQFLLWNLHRTYMESIKMTNANDDSIFRRLVYTCAASEPLIWTYGDRDLVSIIYILSALPIPTTDSRIIPNTTVEFIDYIINVFDNYLTLMPQIGNWTSNGMQILVSQWQLDKMEGSGLIRDTSLYRVVQYASNVVASGIDHEQVFVGLNGRLIEYPQGLPFEVVIDQKATIVVDDIMSKQSMDEDLIILLGTYNIHIDQFTGGPDVVDTEMISAYKNTWGKRKIYSDLMMKNLNPLSLLDQSLQSEFGEGLDFKTSLIINSYLYDSPTNYTFDNDANLLSIGLPGDELSTYWNASTLKELSLLITVASENRTDREFYADLSDKKTILLLGATNEPMTQKIKNFSRNNWQGIGIGDNAQVPNRTSVWTSIMYTGAPYGIISDMNFDEFVTQPAAQVLAYQNWVIRNLDPMIRLNPSFIIFKLQWPIPSLIQIINDMVPDNYGIGLRAAGASPTISEELFLIISSSFNARIGEEHVIEYIQRMGLQENPYELPPIKQIRFTTDVVQNNVNPGDYFVNVGTRAESNTLLSVSSNLSSSVTGGLIRTSLGVNSITTGFVDIVRLALFRRRENYKRSITANGKPRVFTGDFPLRNKEPIMAKADAIKSFQNQMAYASGTWLKTKDPLGKLVSLGGGHFSECWWTEGQYVLYDRNVSYSPGSRGVTIYNTVITDLNMLDILNAEMGNVALINSILMQPGDTHDILIARLHVLVGYVRDTRRSVVGSLYRGDLTQSGNLDTIKRYGTQFIDQNGLQFFTFGKYGVVPMLSTQQGAELYLYALDQGVTLGEIRVPSLFGGAVNARFGMMPNASYLRTAHCASLVHVYFTMAPTDIA